MIMFLDLFSKFLFSERIKKFNAQNIVAFPEKRVFHIFGIEIIFVKLWCSSQPYCFLFFGSCFKFCFI